MTSYRHMTEIGEHMVEVRECCNIWPMFVRLKLALRMLQGYRLVKLCIQMCWSVKAK